MKKNNRFIRDRIYQILISLVSLIGLVILIAVFGYVIKNGSHLLSWDLLTGDYYSEVYDAYYDGNPVTGSEFVAPSNLDNETYFSTRWGIALKDDLDVEGHHYILVVYVDINSPLASLPDKNEEGNYVSVTSGQELGKIIFIDEGYNIMNPTDGAENAIQMFDENSDIYNIILTTSGKGIRGSLITTVYLIVMTLIIALPIGVLTAIYLHEFASKTNKIVGILRRMIEMLTGVPSIIYGLLGAAVFIPFVSSISNADGGSLISGALTLAVIILPVIISSTEETLKTIPDEYRQASLALGATKSQTTFKVILKSAIPGILSAILLSIGRIIGESAALIYAIGTAIKDEIIITERSTSLAVHIWSVMSGETPNFELASAISIIILVVVLLMNLTVKLAVKRISR
ncbi:phosphate ABC transporter permease PstA [Candidatus Izemoplasma sp. B36]|uniref:phosphate ABC transporter permease PstA n=1 Tax=Candidatus Izemoplasma sp. B36 TaxID=3242468 RepID=UPI003558A94E